MGEYRYLTDDPINVKALIAAAAPRPSDGAHVVFAGVVRDHHEGHAVESIFYDAYRPMAEKELGAIADAVRAQFPDVTLALLHRLGHLEVGEVSIGIVTASPHRAEAFDACREVIERIKVSVPIWKKERGPDGEEWVGWQGKC
jgi:molybdopterin synthase catalytic subunit